MAKQGTEVIDLEFYLHHETEVAILVSPNNVRGSPKNQWLAKRLVEWQVKRKNLITVTMPTWLAYEKGFL